MDLYLDLSVLLNLKNYIFFTFPVGYLTNMKGKTEKMITFALPKWDIYS